MPSWGSNAGPFAQVTRPLLDQNGVTLIDTSNSFGFSPLGIALREQVLFGLPNASFSQTPPSPYDPISEEQNPLPYWSIQTTNNITATSVYDSTTETWGVKLDPGTAPSGDSCILRTRAWVTTDNNIALRQKAYLNLVKNGIYAGATQWNITLSATYYDATNVAIGTTVIGTALDNATWTSIGGATTAAGSAISASASWVEFAINLTTTATVTSSTSATLQSLIVATSNVATGQFIVTDVFTSSGTWTRPNGVTNLLGVVAIGGGGGGGGGGLAANLNDTGRGANGGGGGGSSRWGYIQNLYVGDVTSVAVGIGTAGSGGTATSFSKAVGATTTNSTNPTNGGAGGATTFGSYLSIPGGGGAVGTAGGTAAGTITTTVYGASSLASVAGGGGGSTAGGAGNASTASAYVQLPFWSVAYPTGSAGGSAVGAGGTTNTPGTGAIAGTSGIIGSGGGGAGNLFNFSTGAAGVGTAGIGGTGAGGSGGGAVIRYSAAAGTYTGTAGIGGGAGANSGAGGGGGGAAGAVSGNYTNSSVAITSGAGGAGGAGLLLVVYVG